MARLAKCEEMSCLFVIKCIVYCLADKTEDIGHSDDNVECASMRISARIPNDHSTRTIAYFKLFELYYI